MKQNAFNVQLPKHFSLIALVLVQLVCCWVAFLWQRGVVSAAEGLQNCSQVFAVIALLAASALWRKWYLIAASAAMLIELFAFGMTKIAAKWLFEVGRQQLDLPPSLKMLIDVQFYAVVIARGLLLISSFGFLNDLRLNNLTSQGSKHQGGGPEVE
jgi:hypothetical protein